MKTINITKARENIFSLVDEVGSTHEPITIISKKNNVILIDESDWNSLQETLYLQSIPGMVESIREGEKEPIDECIGENELWDTD